MARGYTIEGYLLYTVQYSMLIKSVSTVLCHCTVREGGIGGFRGFYSVKQSRMYSCLRYHWYNGTAEDGVDCIHHPCLLEELEVL